LDMNEDEEWRMKNEKVVCGCLFKSTIYHYRLPFSTDRMGGGEGGGGGSINIYRNKQES